MPEDENSTTTSNTKSEPEPSPSNISSTSAPPSPPSRPRQWLTTPEPIKRLFNKFPLQTLPANRLPLRTAPTRTQHTLYIFTTPSATEDGLPSFNPSCLKWQTYLKFTSFPFATTPSTNHASPTGSLPFLLPASSATPIPGPKLPKWIAAQHLSSQEPPRPSRNPRYDAYISLLDHEIRDAWLHHLYLLPSNLHHVATPLYIHPATSLPPLRTYLTHSLQNAATDALCSSHPTIDPQALLAAADAAFAALSTLLGSDDWFFGQERPGLFDASVFAYTHLLLEEEMGWVEGGLGRMVMGHGNLVRHRRRVYKGWFEGGK